ncbi:hypothetical protein TNCV_1770171 [Trichonephila clavipes]|nr:hypothetical protein TNCV_1770171 [Trichonephila clavipes]
MRLSLLDSDLIRNLLQEQLPELEQMKRRDSGKASDSEEVSEYENHKSNEIESESLDRNFDANNQQMNYKERIQSKRES